ncbi:MAG: hypothetical protein HY220_02345 [Candidatus Sungbacteria bacterium]|uniref:DUF4383 domain-containing protein n=1 Tax=Candidatus Sungiibacteriota bacterium TaxID=2750080 RepID=A0A9D6QS10_9BACT|nr:hypothetical protein [Candidatus Sungbacteria bacterium]
MILTPKGFLTIGGIVLVLVAILGFMGVIGPSPDGSIFGATWWFDNGENWAHLVLGVVGLIAAFAFPASLQKPLVLLLGVIGVLVGLYSLVYSSNFLGANLENPADTFLHLVVGAWALWAAMKKPAMASMPMSSGM